METKRIVKIEVTYTFPLEEVLEALGLEFKRENSHCISIGMTERCMSIGTIDQSVFTEMIDQGMSTGMDNQIPTVEIKIESCVEK